MTVVFWSACKKSLLRNSTICSRSRRSAPQTERTLGGTVGNTRSVRTPLPRFLGCAAESSVATSLFWCRAISGCPRSTPVLDTLGARRGVHRCWTSACISASSDPVRNSPSRSLDWGGTGSSMSEFCRSRLGLTLYSTRRSSATSRATSLNGRRWSWPTIHRISCRQGKQRRSQPASQFTRSL